MAVQELAMGAANQKAERAATYGHWVKRVISFVLDEFVIVPFVAIGYVLIAQGTTGWVTFGITIVAYGMAIGFYNRCIRMGMTGQSWGKMVTGTRLISHRTGKPLGVGAVIIREMCHSADFILVVGSLFPLLDAKRQSLGDKIAGSVVVNVESGEEEITFSLPH
jgi:serine/threonine-protein kinase